MENPSYEYNAPKYLNFGVDKMEDEECEEFFESRPLEEKAHMESENIDKERMDIDPSTVDVFENKDTCAVQMQPNCSLEPSTDDDDIMNVSRDVMESLICQVESLQVEAEMETPPKAKQAAQKKETSHKKTHVMRTRQDQAFITPCINLRSRSVTKNLSEKKAFSLNSKHNKEAGALTAGNDTSYKKRKVSDLANPPNKFLSVAEAVLKYQIETPQRFRTRPRGFVPQFTKAPQQAAKLTIPNSPKLKAVTRSRPVAWLSREEQEEKEAEEMKKYQIKANPLNPEVLKPPPRVRVENKSATKPKPFNLTEVKPKEPPPPSPKFKFVAQPVPKGILEKTGISEQVKTHVTGPKTPTSERKLSLRKQNSVEFEKKSECDVFQFGKSPANRRKVSAVKRCEIKPFSFEERDKEMIRRKEEKIKALLEEEKRLREFHAHPVPEFVKLPSSGDISCVSTTSTVFKEDKEPPVFKARKPTVLFKEPYRPKKESRPLLETTNLVLHTELRSQERAKFDEKQKEKEKLLEEHWKELARQEQLKLEEEALRAKQIAESFKANPVRKLREIKIKPSSLPLTDPATPFSRSRRT